MGSEWWPYHEAFPLADDDGTFEVKMIAVGKSEGLEISVQQFNDGARAVDDPLLDIG